MKSRRRPCGRWLPTPASSVEPASARGSRRKMRASALRFLLVHLLPCLIAMLAFSCNGVAAINRKSLSPDQTRRRRSQSVKPDHWPLTDEQKADQNLQFMLSLYQSAAEPDGRPKQHRKFGSNTVRLLRPSASTVHYLPASKGDIKINCGGCFSLK